MPQQWFVRTSEKTVGPIPSSELKRAAERGRISPDTLVRLANSEKWYRAHQIPGLFPAQTLDENQEPQEHPAQVDSQVAVERPSSQLSSNSQPADQPRASESGHATDTPSSPEAGPGRAEPATRPPLIERPRKTINAHPRFMRAAELALLVVLVPTAAFLFWKRADRNAQEPHHLQEGGPPESKTNGVPPLEKPGENGHAPEPMSSDTEHAAANRLYVQGMLAEREGDWSAAEKRYEEVVRQYPSTAAAVKIHEGRRIERARAKATGGAAAGKQAAASDSEDASGAFTVARLVDQSGNRSSAKQTYQRFLTRFPSSPFCIAVKSRLEELEAEERSERESREMAQRSSEATDEEFPRMKVVAPTVFVSVYEYVNDEAMVMFSSVLAEGGATVRNHTAYVGRDSVNLSIGVLFVKTPARKEFYIPPYRRDRAWGESVTAPRTSEPLRFFVTVQVSARAREL